MAFDIFLTLFLVFLNGFFVAAEFAIVKVRASQINTHKEASPKVVDATRAILNRLDSYLAATQLGVTLASLGLGWVGEEVVAELLQNLFHALNLNLTPETAHQVSLPVAFFVITVLHIVFGELAPKSIAIRHPAPTSLFIAIPLKIFHFVFRPFIWLLNGLANLILKMIGVQPALETDIYTEEEIKLIVSESHQGGSIDETERNLIHNVFDFDNRKVNEIKIHRKKVVVLPVSLSVEEAAAKMLEEGYSRYPVYGDQPAQIIGMVYTRDVLRAHYEKSQKTLKELMREAYFVPENKLIRNLLRELQQKKVQVAITVDEFGSYTGIVTMEDILEELVGEIQDEYDDEKPIVEKTGEHQYLVDAQQSITDINKHIPVPLEISNDYITLSGLLMEQTGNVLAKDQVVAIGPYEVCVIKTGTKSVERVQLTLQEMPGEEEEE